MLASIRPTGRATFMRLAGYQEIDCLIIIKFDNMRIKYDIFIKKCDNIYRNE